MACRANHVNLFVAIPEAPGLLEESAIDVAMLARKVLFLAIQYADRATDLFVVVRQL